MIDTYCNLQTRFHHLFWTYSIINSTWKLHSHKKYAKWKLYPIGCPISDPHWWFRKQSQRDSSIHPPYIELHSPCLLLAIYSLLPQGNSSTLIPRETPTPIQRQKKKWWASPHYCSFLLPDSFSFVLLYTASVALKLPSYRAFSDLQDMKHNAETDL